MSIKKTNIELDLDERILEFINENIEDRDFEIEEKVKDIVIFALNEQKITVEKVYISIQSMTEVKIKAVNKEYRNIDKVTDVLSFPIFDKAELDKLKIETDEEKKLKEIDLGDIILCLSVIKSQSEEYGTGIIREILYMITHGVCHLLGFDHIDPDDKVDMRKLEEKILDNIGVGR